MEAYPRCFWLRTSENCYLTELLSRKRNGQEARDVRILGVLIGVLILLGRLVMIGRYYTLYIRPAACIHLHPFDFCWIQILQSKVFFTIKTTNMAM